MTVLAAFEVLIGRYTAMRDFAIGTPVSGRSHPQTEALVGHFVNTVPLRADLTGDPAFTELLTRVRTSTLAAFDHDDVPFDRIVELLRPQRDLTRTPLVQIVFALQNNDEAGWALPGLAVEQLAVDTRVSKFDLELALAQDAAWRPHRHLRVPDRPVRHHHDRAAGLPLHHPSAQDRRRSGNPGR